MNQKFNEFDPTNTQDPHYDATLHHQVEEQRAQEQQQTPPAPEQPAAPSQAAPAAPERRSTEVPGVKDAPMGGLAYSEEALKVKEKLAKEPRVPMFVPLDPGERAGEAYRSVTINGYRCEIKKGKMVQVPVSIQKILMDAYQIESETLNENEYNLNNADSSKRRALGLE